MLSNKTRGISGVLLLRDWLHMSCLVVRNFCSFSSLSSFYFLSLWYFHFSLQIAITIIGIIIVLSWSQPTSSVTFALLILHPSPLAFYINTWQMEWQNYFWNETIEVILMEKTCTYSTEFKERKSLWNTHGEMNQLFKC